MLRFLATGIEIHGRRGVGFEPPPGTSVGTGHVTKEPCVAGPRCWTNAQAIQAATVAGHCVSILWDLWTHSPGIACCQKWLM